MTKTFLRTLLAGFAAAGVAGAQTPPPALTPTSTPPAPAPVQQVAFKQVLPQAKPPEKLVAAKAATPASKPHESLCVRVQVRLVTLPVGNAAVKDLFAVDCWRVKPQAVTMTAEALATFTERLAGDRQASVMQAPRMNHFDRQSMDFRVGDDLWFGTDRRSVRVFVGTACQLKPTLGADGKSVELAVDLRHTERDGGAERDVRNLKTLAVKDTFHLPVGGSIAVRLGTRTVTMRTEFGPPVLSEIPYLNRLFKNVGVCEVESDVVALFTVEAVMPPDDESFVSVAKLDRPAPAKLYTKVFDVTDLVCPPADSPLAKPGEDVAMQAAVRAFTSAKAEQLMKQVRDMMTAASWEENGGSGKMAFAPNGQSLVVNGSTEVLTHVGECLTAAREAKRPPVFVQMVVLSAKSDHPAVTKLQDKKRATPLTPEEVNAILVELKKDGAADILSRPQLMLRNKQTGLFQTGQHFPRLSNTTPAEKGAPVHQQVEYINTGLVVRATPDVSADGKFVRLMTEVSMTEPSPSLIDLGNGVKAQPIDCQSVESTLVVPDGGTIAVNVGLKKVEQRIEHKLPVLGDLPYVGRLFRHTATTHERRETIVVFTVTQVKSEQEHQRVIDRQSLEMQRYAPTPTPAVIPPLEVQRHNGSPLPPNAVPVPRSTTVPAGVTLPPAMPGLPPAVAPVAVPPLSVVPIAPPPPVHCVEGSFLPPPVAVLPSVIRSAVHGTTYHTPDRSAVPPQAVWLLSQVTPIPMPIHNPFLPLLPVVDGVIISRFGVPGPAAVPGPAFNFSRTTGPDGLERIGVDFSTVPASGSVPVSGSIGAAAGGPFSDDTVALIKAYRAACVAGRKDEASRLALQLLAKDPTCFGRDR